MRQAAPLPTRSRQFTKAAILQGIFACLNFISEMPMIAVDIIRLSKTITQMEISPDSKSAIECDRAVSLGGGK